MYIILQARGASLQALFFIVLCIAIMVVDHRFHHLEVVRANISLALTPLRYLVSLPATGGNWLGDWFTSHTELLNENEKLKADGRILNARLQKLEILAEENARLRNLLGSARKISDDVIVAELLSVDQNPYRQLIEINKGSGDGVGVSGPSGLANGGDMIDIDCKSCHGVSLQLHRFVVYEGSAGIQRERRTIE